MNLKISEMFETIQGEGMFAGIPSYFVRVSGCNLRCWWCDTPYTSWNPEGKLKELNEIINTIADSACQHVVITGGEPMLYPKQICALVHDLNEVGKIVTIETNGTRYDPTVEPDLWSVSPKLTSSTPDKSLGEQPHAVHKANINAVNLSQFRYRCRVQFKFVIGCDTSEGDLKQVESFIESHSLPKAEVWLMPEGVTEGKILRGGRLLAEVCKLKGYNLCLRQHVLLWGHRRGV